MRFFDLVADGAHAHDARSVIRIFGMLMFIMLMFCVTGANADYSWPLFGTSVGRHSEPIFDYNLYSTPMSSNEFVDSCTITPGTGQVLIDSQYHYVWVVSDDTLTVYDSNCVIMDTITLGGTAQGTAVIWNSDGDAYPDIFIDVNTGTHTILKMYSMNASYELNPIYLWALNEVTNCYGVQCANSGETDYCVSYCYKGVNQDKYAERINVDSADGLLDEYALSEDCTDALPNLGTDNGADVSGVTKADYDQDNTDEMLLWWAGNSGNQIEYIIYNPITAEPEGTCHEYDFASGTAGASPEYGMMGAACMFGQVGDPESTVEVFCALSGTSGSQSMSMMFGATSAGTVFKRFTGLGTASSRYKLTNWVTGDFDLDGVDEYCGMNRTNDNDVWLQCFDSDNSLIAECNYTSTYTANVFGSMGMFDYDPSNSYMELVTVYGIYDMGDCSEAFDLGLDSTDTYRGTFIMADVSDDDEADLIYSDPNFVKLWKTSYGSSSASNAVCTFASCSGSCMFRDTFSYSCTLESMGYSFTPTHPELVPAAGKLCYNASGEVVESRYGFVTPSFTNMLSDQFDMLISAPDGAYVEHRLTYYDYDTAQSLNAISLNFYSIAGEGYISASNQTAAWSICSDCWTPGVTFHVAATMFIYDSEGMSFYNSTSAANRTMPVLPGTYTLVIDSDTDKTYANIGLASAGWNVNHSILPLRLSNTFVDSRVCIDNIYLSYEGASANTGITASLDRLQVGDRCANGNECLTGLCEYGFCAYKRGGMTCSYGWQCLSKECINGYCSKESLWTSIDASKTQQFGDDTMSNSVIALFFMIGIPIVLVIMFRDFIGALAGAFTFIALTFFFTIVGWLNPLIGFGVFVVVVFMFVIGFSLRGGGGGG